MAADVIAGRYRLDRLLGKGGMSEVWAATDLELERTVALKLLAPDADRARFDREARAVAALAHPNIVQLYDYGEFERRPYMVLEFAPGGTLEERLVDRKPLPDDQAHAIATDIAAGLAHAHARGLVHRDLKPANILFDGEGRAKIGDFGIARLGEGGTLTEAGTVLGTAAYISPEQAAGAPATPASDVYSFGVLLFRLLTGRLPFEAEQPMELVEMHRDREPPPVTAFRDDAPGRLEAVATAALAKDPADRPPDGSALLRELGGPRSATTLAADDATRVLPAVAAGAATAAGTAVATGPPPPGPPTARPLRRVLLGALILLLAAAGLAVAFAVTRTGGSGSAPPTIPVVVDSTPKKHHKPTTGATSAPPTTQATSAPPTTKQQTTTHRQTTAPTTTAPTPSLPTTAPLPSTPTTTPTAPTTPGTTGP